MWGKKKQKETAQQKPRRVTRTQIVMRTCLQETIWLPQDQCERHYLKKISSQK